MEPPRRRLGGVGALFFLATLGVIAFYVQRQEVPEEHDAIRTSATALTRVAEEEPAAPTPWSERLDLASVTFLEIGAAGEAAEGSPEAATAESGAPDHAQSRYVQELEDGSRVLYTLDPTLQESALQIFRNREVPYAAAVVLDVEDNAVLALAGHSSMDPKVDPLEILTTAWAPAASTFKIVTAAALLEHKRANAHTRACFSGGLRGITDDLLRDDPNRDTRCATLSDAVAHSHNVVIAKLAMKYLDREQLVATSEQLAFTHPLAFEFPVEASPANIPADPRERAKVAAGFWHVDMSPLHGAVLASVFARGGLLQAPHIVEQVVNAAGEELTPPLPKTARVLRSEVAREVGAMMVGTTTEGTAKGSFRDQSGVPYIADVVVAGKTGSLTGRRAPALNYNWFIGFAPADDPEIAFAVLLANEPKWRIKAHYAGRRLVQIYLERRDAIREHRRARLQRDGSLALPSQAGATAVAHRDTQPSAKPGASGSSRDDASSAASGEGPQAAAAAADGDDALPPVPGPVARPETSQQASDE
ncbi:MAG: penicillin-binding transpeptidase domain-containing protein [Nannocystaceae bacterium]